MSAVSLALSPYGGVDFPALLRRFESLSIRPWFPYVAPAALVRDAPADRPDARPGSRPPFNPPRLRCAGWPGLLVEAAFQRRDLATLRDLVDGVGVLDDCELGDSEMAEARFVAHGDRGDQWLTPQADALRTCLLRIEHACALHVWAESWS